MSQNASNTSKTTTDCAISRFHISSRNFLPRERQARFASMVRAMLKPSFNAALGGICDVRNILEDLVVRDRCNMMNGNLLPQYFLDLGLRLW